MDRRNHIPGAEGTQLDDEFIEREYQYPAEPGSQTGDMSSAGAALDALDRAPSGELPPGFDVRSTYDVRPVNARDFNITVSNVDNITTVTELSFVVPQGHIAVLRRIRHFFANPAPASSDRNDVTLTVLVDTAAVPYNLDIPVGTEQDEIATYFELADENSLVTARFTISAGIVATNAQLTATFCGNLLAKTGRPLPFEIANPSTTAPSHGPFAPMVAPAQPAPLPAFTPPVQTPVPSGPARPPFPIVWSYALDQKGPRVYYPMADVRPRRVLTPDEQFTYREYLAATRPKS